MLMNVIVSCDIDKTAFDNFIVVDSFSAIKKLGTPCIETLIIHHFKEKVFDVGIFINECKDSGIKRFIYISENPDETIKMCLKGLNSYVYTTEDYLEDEEELKFLIDDIIQDENKNSTALSNVEQNVNILEEFIDGFKRKDPKIGAPIYLNRAQEAVNELSVVTQKQELQLTTMGEESRKIFSQARTIIEQLILQNKEREAQILEAQQNANTTAARVPMSSSVSIYAPYSHFSAVPVLLFREYSPCRYLTSFVMAYEHYLHYQLNKRVKLIICHSKDAQISKKYTGNDFVAITDVSYKTTSLYDNEKIAINVPKKDLLKKLIDVSNIDIVIVVDRLYGNTPIIKGKHITTINAISGSSDVERFGLSNAFADTIIPVSEFKYKGKSPFVTLKTIQDFPPEIDTRYAAYTLYYKEIFSKLDEKLKLVRS